jgi:hypothetical protein
MRGGVTMRRIAERMRLVGEIVVAYLSARRLMHRRPLPDAVAALRLGAGDGRDATGAALPLARHLASATARTITLMPVDSRCLMRSLVLTRLMGRRGLGSTLVLSVSAQPSQFEAHAWIEHAGVALLPAEPDGHEQIVRL